MESRDANDTSKGPEEGTLEQRYDFFLSYAPADEPWAVWIAGQLEHAGYHVFVHAWDLRPGRNIILTTHKALLDHPRILLIVSSDFPQEDLPQAEWAAALLHDLTGEKQVLVPVRVASCKLGGLLAPLQPLDLFDLSEQEALAKLLAGISISTDRGRLTKPSPFPGPPASIAFPSQLGGHTTSITTVLSDLAGFRDAVEQYRKQVGRTQEELARELSLSREELNKRLHNYSHPRSGRTWRLQPEDAKRVVATLAKWGAITTRKQMFVLFVLANIPALAKIEWEMAPWNKLHSDILQMEHQSVLPQFNRRESAQNSVPSLVSQPIDYYTCFISYSSQDHTLAEHLYSDLQKSGVRCWFAPEDLKIGAKLRPSIDESIRSHDKLLIVLSKHSVASQWVEQEVETALEKERKEGRIVLFPIRLDNAVMEVKEGWPALIRNTRHIGDFTHWQQFDAYQKASERLLRDLKADV